MILILIHIVKIKSQLKSLFYKLIFNSIKLSENDLKSNFVNVEYPGYMTLKAGLPNWDTSIN
jgi:hypothetical protein